MATRLTLDRYAEIRAEMEAGVLRDDALARAGLSVDEWTAAQHDWLESMGTEIALGRFELSRRYAQAFLERQRALAKPAPKAPAKPLASTRAAGPDARSAIQPPPSLPPAEPSVPAIAAMSTAAIGGPIREALPFQPHAASAQQAVENAKRHAEALQGPTPDPTAGRSGATIDVRAAVRAPLPFGGPPSPLLPAGSGPTVALGAPPPREALPFTSESPAPERALERAIAHAKLVQGPAAAPSESTSGATVDVGAAKAPPLPFAKAPDPKGASAPIAPAPKIPELALEQYAALHATIQANPDRLAQILKRYQLSPEAKAILDTQWRARFDADHGLYAAFTRAYYVQQASLVAATGALPSAAPAAAPGGATRAIEPPAVALTVEQYAALCAELSAVPARAPEIRARYGIFGDAAWGSVTRHWEAQLNRDAALRARWMTLVREIGSTLPRRG